MLALSGSVRAQLRVFVSKHFFRYRYDYREEWLRFTQALSAQDGQPQLGQQVDQGLADMLESPAGGLWLRDARGRSFAQAARWNMPRQRRERRTVDSAFVDFLRVRGWVVNLEEYRSSPERYRELELAAVAVASPAMPG